MSKILITDEIDSEAIQKLGTEFDVTHDEIDYQQLLDIIRGYDALIVRSRTRVTKDVIERSTLKVIGRAGVGVDNIDVNAATSKGIIVVNAPTSSTVSVAELTIAHMLSLARHLPQADTSVKSGKWEKRLFRGIELYGKTLGLIGIGRIGCEVARLANAFGLRTIGYDPYASTEIAQRYKIQLTDLDTLLSTSDFISIHAWLSEETRGMISVNEIAKMKNTAYIINCARGGIVDEKALYDALKNGNLAGAALDVFEVEPPIDNKLLTLPNVVVTPHLGASTIESQKRAGMIIAEQVAKILNGRSADYVVNKEVICDR
jgi:D-3-phosphoglycerate dehydrogenase